MRRGLLVLLLLIGCAGQELRTRVVEINGVIKEARANGAYKCAPRELALAESHSAFASQELDEGDYYRAKDELDVADHNANAAIKLSPRERCTVVPVAERPDGDRDGIPDDADKCPYDPEDKDGFEDIDGCPDNDNDADTIEDLADKCANTPEDRDGHQDQDGCPDPDNDGDGKADNVDRCPNEPATTEDGCPKKYTMVEVTKEKIVIKQTIYFDFNKASIRPISYALLNEVAQALRDNATIRVRVEGHTDSRGNANYNLQLSQNRAESVRNYLIGQGIPAERMEAKGFGKVQPIADNRTEDGREQNRRVEFIIVSQ